MKGAFRGLVRIFLSELLKRQYTKEKTLSTMESKENETRQIRIYKYSGKRQIEKKILL